jgi:hypothetical protein
METCGANGYNGDARGLMMARAGFDGEWQALSNELLSGMREWRLRHPKATLSEMEGALDKPLSRFRARVLQDMALASESANLSQVPPAERPVCLHCGTPLGSRGEQERRLQTQGGAELVLNRSYAVCPTCKTGLFPPR